jgi:hypothetical protein
MMVQYGWVQKKITFGSHRGTPMELIEELTINQRVRLDYWSIQQCSIFVYWNTWRNADEQKWALTNSQHGPCSSCLHELPCSQPWIHDDASWYCWWDCQLQLNWTWNNPVEFGDQHAQCPQHGTLLCLTSMLRYKWFWSVFVAWVRSAIIHHVWWGQLEILAQMGDGPDQKRDNNDQG